MLSHRLTPDETIERLTADLRRLRQKVEVLVERIRRERATHDSATTRQVRISEERPYGPLALSAVSSALPGAPVPEKPE